MSSSTTRSYGSDFSPTMTLIEYRDGEWGPTQMVPFGNLPLSAAAMVLHYGQAIFEGMKAYRDPEGGVRLFRPERNAERLQHSAARMSMPSLPVDRFLDAVTRQVNSARDSVPDESGYSLYIRPFMIATEAALGTRPANEYLFVVITSPSGPYFSNFDAITIGLSEDYPRAFPGGTGSAKAAGNYAAGMLAQQAASSVGGVQVLFLDAVERRYLEELGGMNVFIVRQDDDQTVIATPPLSDTILHGITRDTVITLADEFGAIVEQRPISIDEVRDGAADGTVTEVFACGTAAIVTPIGTIRTSHGDIVIGDGTPGTWSTDLRMALLDIQEGRTPDRHGWMHAL